MFFQPREVYLTAVIQRKGRLPLKTSLSDSYYLFLLRGISVMPADTRPGLYGRRMDISSPNTNIVI